MRALAAAALLAALSPAARANEPTENDAAVRRAKFIPNAELKRALESLGAPAPKGPAGDPFAAMEDLKSRIQGILPMLERLEALKDGYAALPDLAPVDAERGPLRSRLAAAQAEFNDGCQRFNELRKRHQTEELQAILVGGQSQGVPEKISRAMDLEHFSDEAKDVRLKTAAVLADDEEAYRKAAAALAARRRSRQAGAAGAGALVLAGGAVALLRRRRPGAAAQAGAGEALLAPGTSVGGNFRIERELGRGGMGVVYEATDLALRRKVALKRLRSELRENPKELALLLEEARLVAALRHPNIVEIYSIVQEPAETCLIFELVAGSPLSALLQRTPRLALPQARGLLSQVGLALDYAHGQKVIHRDLKPANVMVTAQGAVKVMDFGLAHQAQQTVARQTRAESWGTPPYMAPEQEMGAVSRESDLYALAVLFYEAVTGKLPFPGPNYLAQKRELAFVPASKAAPGVPYSVDPVFARAFQPDPAQRFHSAAELVAAVDLCVGR